MTHRLTDRRPLKGLAELLTIRDLYLDYICLSILGLGRGRRRHDQTGTLKYHDSTYDFYCYTLRGWLKLYYLYLKLTNKVISSRTTCLRRVYRSSRWLLQIRSPSVPLSPSLTCAIERTMFSKWPNFMTPCSQKSTGWLGWNTCPWPWFEFYNMIMLNIL